MFARLSKMKKFILLTLILALTLAFGCSPARTQQTSVLTADEITMSKAISSYLFVTKNDGTDADLINELVADYNDLTVEPTSDEIDVLSMYIIGFHKDGNLVGTLSIDKHGVIWIDGSTENVRQIGGEFSYSRIEEIVNNARQEDGIG